MLCTLDEILKPTRTYKFAVPAFNTSTSMILKAAIETSEELNAPVIIEIHPVELRMTRDSFTAAVLEEAHRAKVPVCIHLDHGSSFEEIMHAIACGFTSVMIDCSAMPFEENVAQTRKVVEAAHAAGVSVEAELGRVGSMNDSQIHYTDPDEAKRFFEETGVDALAVSIGTRHGLYPKGLTPKLRLDLLDEIRNKVSVPLVLHGGSDNPDDEIEQACLMGISKLNISSDIKRAFYDKCREVLSNPKVYDPTEIYPPCIDAMKAVMRKKMELFHTAGKASLYK